MTGENEKYIIYPVLANVLCKNNSYIILMLIRLSPRLPPVLVFTYMIWFHHIKVDENDNMMKV